MKTDIKEKWLDALRSGGYKQGQDRLRSTNDRFCCLGVLCDVVDPQGWVNRRNSGYYYEYGDSTNSVSVPIVLRDAIDLDEDVIGTAMEMNDRGARFTDIADFLERSA